MYPITNLQHQSITLHNKIDINTYIAIQIIVSTGIYILDNVKFQSELHYSLIFINATGKYRN